MDRFLHADITERVLGAAFRVHRALGPGFLESVYEEALVCELKHQGIPYQQQLAVPVLYRGQVVGNYRLDLLVDGKVIVELKTVKQFADIHIAIVQAYLAAANLQVGLLLNFAKQSLEHKRVYRKGTPGNQDNQVNQENQV